MEPEETIGKWIAYTDHEENGGCTLALIKDVRYKNNIHRLENTWLITSQLYISIDGNSVLTYTTERMLLWKNLIGKIEVIEKLSISQESFDRLKEQIMIEGVLLCKPIKKSILFLINDLLPEKEKDKELKELLEKQSIKDLMCQKKDFWTFSES